MGILIFKGLTERRHYKSFCVKGLRDIRVDRHHSEGLKLKNMQLSPFTSLMWGKMLSILESFNH
jgi:hypothetical protein